MDFVSPPSSSENKKGKYESLGNQTKNIKDNDDAMSVDSGDDDEFSNSKNSDSDYEADNDLDCYLSDEDVQPKFRKMEHFQAQCLIKNVNPLCFTTSYCYCCQCASFVYPLLSLSPLF